MTIGETTHSNPKTEVSLSEAKCLESLPKLKSSLRADACICLHTWTRQPLYSLAQDCLWRPQPGSPLLSVDLLLVSVLEQGYTQEIDL